MESWPEKASHSPRRADPARTRAASSVRRFRQEPGAPDQQQRIRERHPRGRFRAKWLFRQGFSGPVVPRCGQVLRHVPIRSAGGGLPPRLPISRLTARGPTLCSMSENVRENRGFGDLMPPPASSDDGSKLLVGADASRNSVRNSGPLGLFLELQLPLRAWERGIAAPAGSLGQRFLARHRQPGSGLGTGLAALVGRPVTNTGF